MINIKPQIKLSSKIPKGNNIKALGQSKKFSLANIAICRVPAEVNADKTE